MPTISRFFGIAIRMYEPGKAHDPPHIHVIYNEDTASINIRTGEVMDGDLTPRTLSLVLEWLDIHRDELLEMWETGVVKSIAPLA